MYTIGEFARIGMVSTSALRFYDEIGLLKPYSIDRYTGYRHYSQQQVEDILFIAEMREYGYSLEEIKAILQNKDKKMLGNSLSEKYHQLFWEEQKITYIRKKLKEKINYLESEDDVVNTEKRDNERMEIKVIERKEVIRTAGISIEIPVWPPEDLNVFGNLWLRYWDEDISNKIPNKKFPSTRYGILAFNKGAIHYMVVDEVTSYENIPDVYTRFDIPKGKYAACTFRGKTFDELVNSSLNKANDYLLTTWLPQTKYKHAESFSLEVYDDRSRRREYPEMDIWQPVIE